MMPNCTKYLFCLDYDQTLFNTFNPSPNKIGVFEAYRFAIESIFEKEGLKIYEQIGGLQNRAPSELVEELLKNGNKNLLIRNADIFFRSKTDWLKNLAAQGKFIIPEWNKSSSDRDIREAVSEMIILLKLFHLMKEIGTVLPNGNLWPEPCSGIMDFFQTVEDINREKKAGVQLAILSSGHTEFVKKSFEIRSKKCPEILITDDDVRKLPVALKDKVKPSRFLFGLVYAEWLKKRGLNSESLEISENDRQNIIYIGDDPVKDGKLAELTKILFGWFNPENKIYELNKDNAFSFNDWKKISDILKNPDTIKKIQQGKPLNKIFRLI